MRLFRKIELHPKKFLHAFIAMYAVTFLIQGYLIFPSYMANIASGKMKSPEEYHLSDFTEIPLEASDGTRLVAWSHPPKIDMPIILYFHGNAMHLAARIPRFKAFANEGYGVLALSYRGYGKSKGTPSEKGLYLLSNGIINAIRVRNVSRSQKRHSCFFRRRA